MSLEERDFTKAIIGAAIEVHRSLGPGFLEALYEEALCLELTARGMPHVRQREAEIRYRGVVIGTHRVDLLIADRIVVELKATRAVDTTHYAVVKSYLRALNLKHGLILNFAATPLDIRRVTVVTGLRSDD